MVTKAKKTVAPKFTLAHVIEATKADSFVYTDASFHEPLVVSGDVMINPAMVQDGMIATRATDKHLIETTMTEPIIQNTVTAATAKPLFAIVTGEMIPEKVRRTTGPRAGRTAIYPFEDLPVGGYFFVANSTKVGAKPAFKSMASTVAGANAKFVEEIAGESRVNRKGNTVPATKQLRMFKLFDSEIEQHGVKVLGAKIFRVPLESATAE